MPDALKWKHLTQEVVYQLSKEEWLTAAYHQACDGFVRGKSWILSTHNGVWRVGTDSMTAVADLVLHREIVWGIHQLNDIRPLPLLRAIMPAAPIEVGKPMAMLRSIPFRQMPENLWCEFAWRMAVDPETAETTKLISCDNGIWRVRCHSEHAWELLHYPEAIQGMLAWLSRLRKLPDVRQIVPLLGELKETTSENKAEIIDDSDIPDSIKDPAMRRILAKLRPLK